MTFAVPIVDLTDASAVDAVDDACARVGFFQLAGHGVDPSLIDGLLAAAETFFRLPTREKRRYVPPSPSINRGWAPLGSESLAYSLGVDAPPDLFESFNIGHEHDATNPVHMASRDSFFAPNIWPDRLPGFRAALLAYFDAAERVAHRLTDLFDVALDVPPGFFAASTGHSPDVMRINWYERQPGAAELLPDQQRMGAHTDYGVLTVLYGDAVPGLEIVAPDGEWTSVVPEPGCLLVNLGDLLAQWTNDRWRSTLHRVAPPPASETGPALRRSVAFFHEANADAVVEAIPSCVTPDRPAKYPPVTAGEHLVQKLLGPRELRPSTALSTLGERAAAVGRPADSLR